MTETWKDYYEHPFDRFPRKKILVRVTNFIEPCEAYSDTFGMSGFSHEYRPIEWKELE